MKKLVTRCMIVFLMATLAIGVAKADDFNWVQWYEWNGVYSVTGGIKRGEMSPTEACDKIIIPAYQAGKVDSVDLQIIKEEIPEAIDYLITLQHLQQSRLLPYLHTLSRIVICRNTQLQT